MRSLPSVRNKIGIDTKDNAAELEDRPDDHEDLPLRQLHANITRTDANENAAHNEHDKTNEPVG